MVTTSVPPLTITDASAGGGPCDPAVRATGRDGQRHVRLSDQRRGLRDRMTRNAGGRPGRLRWMGLSVLIEADFLAHGRGRVLLPPVRRRCPCLGSGHRASVLLLMVNCWDA